MRCRRRPGREQPSAAARQASITPGPEATSLLAIIPVAMLGSWRQTREGAVRWTDATIIGLVSVATAIAGALIADVAPERALRLGFAALLVLTAVQLVLRARRQADA